MNAQWFTNEEVTFAWRTFETDIANMMYDTWRIIVKITKVQMISKNLNLYYFSILTSFRGRLFSDWNWIDTEKYKSCMDYYTEKTERSAKRFYI
jgi:competence CoiA-like predicted nuclease